MSQDLDQKKKALLLVNLGTPDSPSLKDVRRYLKEFLMDPDVLDIPSWFRWLLVHGVIVPKRAKTSAEAYQSIWTPQGSPLAVHLKALVQKVKGLMGPEWIVQGAMRYGQPSLTAALQSFKNFGIQEIFLFPLYPQYAVATTESSIKACRKLIQQFYPSMTLQVVPPFYRFSKVIQTWAQLAKKTLASSSVDHWLFSYHGLPERQIRRADATRHYCFSSILCCEQEVPQNSQCYRAHCFETSRRLAAALSLSKDQYTISFQSRLGQTPWLKPYTDEFLKNAPRQGIRRLVVLCPSFVADCLETLEEIQLRGRQSFIQSGGQQFFFVPALNAHDSWAEAIVAWVNQQVI